MPRLKAPPRVTGPYQERGGTRFRIRIINGQEQNLYFPSWEEALRAKKAAEKELICPRSLKLADLIEEYFTEKERLGKCQPSTCVHEKDRLRGFLAEYLETDMSAVTPKRAAALYKHAVEKISPTTGRPLAVATHQLDLVLAKGLFTWAARKNYVGSNPFADVQPEGRVNTGKPQLRIEEAMRFVDVGLQLFDGDQDVLALAALVALLMGLRASEVLRRAVRDVDAGGKILWIEKGKTKNARRHLKVPKVLQPRLLRLATGKPPEAPLFGLGSTGKPRRCQVLLKAVERLCKKAGVPRVCTHSMRGLWATLSVESGALSDVVAASLGHGSFETTARHYAQPEAISGARTARMVEMLALEPDSDALTALTPDQLLAKLPPETLAKLVDLASQQSPPEPPSTPSAAIAPQALRSHAEGSDSRR